MVIYGGFRTVWVFVLFDLPTETKKQRREYAIFRKKIMSDGFTMQQYSVYIRHCASDQNAAVHIERVKTVLPPEGEVRVLVITDNQFGRMKVFYGKKRKAVETPPAQLEFF